MRPKLVIAIAAVALLTVAGCKLNIEPAGPMQHETKTVDRDKSELVHAEVTMGAGELKIRGGSSKLLDADFEYNVPSWKPQVKYESSGFRGKLIIAQPSASGTQGNVKSKWDLRISDEVPLDMLVKLGAGEAGLNLGSLSLRSLEVDLGAGQLKLDLRGNPQRDYDVKIRGGVGEATVWLPKGVGLRADAHGGIGGINVEGLEKNGDFWQNSAYEHSKVTVRVDVRGGVGNINVIAGQ